MTQRFDSFQVPTRGILSLDTGRPAHAFSDNWSLSPMDQSTAEAVYNNHR